MSAHLADDVSRCHRALPAIQFVLDALQGVASTATSFITTIACTGDAARASLHLQLPQLFCDIFEVLACLRVHAGNTNFCLKHQHHSTSN